MSSFVLERISRRCISNTVCCSEADSHKRLPSLSRSGIITSLDSVLNTCSIRWRRVVCSYVDCQPHMKRHPIFGRKKRKKGEPDNSCRSARTIKTFRFVCSFFFFGHSVRFGCACCRNSGKSSSCSVGHRCRASSTTRAWCLEIKTPCVPSNMPNRCNPYNRRTTPRCNSCAGWASARSGSSRRHFFCGAAHLAGRRRPLPSKKLENAPGRIILLSRTLIPSPFRASGQQWVDAAKNWGRKESPWRKEKKKRRSCRDTRDWAHLAHSGF